MNTTHSAALQFLTLQLTQPVVYASIIAMSMPAINEMCPSTEFLIEK